MVTQLLHLNLTVLSLPLLEMIHLRGFGPAVLFSTLCFRWMVPNTVSVQILECLLSFHAVLRCFGLFLESEVTVFLWCCFQCPFNTFTHVATRLGCYVI